MNIIEIFFLQLSKYYDSYRILPPYDYVQNVVSRHLHTYVNSNADEIFNITIVGGYLGKEIPGLLKTFPNSEICVFECSPRYAGRLSKKYNDLSRVKVVTKAVSDCVGISDFYETSLRGSGSLLKLGSLAEDSYGARSAEVVSVDTTTLDTEMSGVPIDCLWIDVQGAEHKVLSGAESILGATKSLFVEVSLLPDLYHGGALIEDLLAQLKRFNFRIALLGTDKKNLTGNAFFLNADYFP